MIVTLGAFLENPTGTIYHKSSQIRYEGVDIFIFIVFLIVAQLQMLFSTIFHMFGCHSPQAYSWLAKVDYSGTKIIFPILIVRNHINDRWIILPAALLWIIL
jgi:predicted membrane channel-forming protein YqfA (hemolysin III family)